MTINASMAEATLSRRREPPGLPKLRPDDETPVRSSPESARARIAEALYRPRPAPKPGPPAPVSSTKTACISLCRNNLPTVLAGDGFGMSSDRVLSELQHPRRAMSGGFEKTRLNAAFVGGSSDHPALYPESFLFTAIILPYQEIPVFLGSGDGVLYNQRLVPYCRSTSTLGVPALR